MYQSERIRTALEALPEGTLITLPRDALLAWLASAYGERGASVPTPETPDRLITAAEVAARMGVSRKRVYEDADKWSFTRRLGDKTLRFSEKGFERWIARQR